MVGRSPCRRDGAGYGVDLKQMRVTDMTRLILALRRQHRDVGVTPALRDALRMYLTIAALDAMPGRSRQTSEQMTPSTNRYGTAYQIFAESGLGGIWAAILGTFCVCF